MIQLSESKQRESNKLLKKLIYHSTIVSSCKKLVLNYEKMRSQTKVVLGENHFSVAQISGIIFDLETTRKKHFESMIKTASKFIKINNLSTELKADGIVPFATSEIKEGYSKVITNDDRIYYIILNQGIIIDENVDNFQSHIDNADSSVPKGYSILF